MEDTHGDEQKTTNWLTEGLNPYYNGRYSWSYNITLISLKRLICLNPYYNGRYSWSNDYLSNKFPNIVLILIIMEDTHGARLKGKWLRIEPVLILIIMEDTHGVMLAGLVLGVAFVLILIIMEDTHGGVINGVILPI